MCEETNETKNFLHLFVVDRVNSGGEQYHDGNNTEKAYIATMKKEYTTRPFTAG